MVGPLVNVRAGVELDSEPVAQLEFGQKFEVWSTFISCCCSRSRADSFCIAIMSVK